MLETILRCDTERTKLLQEEARIMTQLNGSEAPANGHAPAAGGAESGTKGRLKPAVSVSADPEAAAKLEKVGWPLALPCLACFSAHLSMPAPCGSAKHWPLWKG